MKIIVKGKSSKNLAPNQVILEFAFRKKAKTYEAVFKEGINSVQLFIDNILLKLNFKKEDLKTRGFIIRENETYNKELDKYEKDGFTFCQFASLSFYYNKKRMAQFLELYSSMENIPTCKIKFGVKNILKHKNDIIVKAFKDAENQAIAIAKAANLNIKRCESSNIDPFYDNDRYINDSMEIKNFNMLRKFNNTSEQISNTFTPQDITISTSIECVWIAE